MVQSSFTCPTPPPSASIPRGNAGRDSLTCYTALPDHLDIRILGMMKAEDSGVVPASEDGEEKKLTSHYVRSLSQGQIDPAVLDLFEKYSRIPRESVVKHVEEVRDKAWDIFPYYCIGRMTFLDISLRLQPQYAQILEQVKAGALYLDIGCCFGQDIRKLVFDGAPAENLYGTDLEEKFFALGHELFNDGETLNSKFIASDLTDPADKALDSVAGSLTIIHASSFFHLFDWNTQIQCAKKCVELLRKQPGSIVIGRQGASSVAQERDHPFRKAKIFNHNDESWKKMWKDVGVVTGTKWRVETEMVAEPETLEQGRFGGSMRMRYICYLE